MTPPSYFAPTGGHPDQRTLLSDRAVFTEAYAVLPRGTMRDIVTSFLPFWERTRLWVIARPLSGFAETFSQYIMEVQPGGWFVKDIQGSASVALGQLSGQLDALRLATG